MLMQDGASEVAKPSTKVLETKVKLSPSTEPRNPTEEESRAPVAHTTSPLARVQPEGPDSPEDLACPSGVPLLCTPKAGDPALSSHTRSTCAIPFPGTGAAWADAGPRQLAESLGFFP